MGFVHPLSSRCAAKEAAALIGRRLGLKRRIAAIQWPCLCNGINGLGTLRAYCRATCSGVLAMNLLSLARRLRSEAALIDAAGRYPRVAEALRHQARCAERADAMRQFDATNRLTLAGTAPDETRH